MDAQLKVRSQMEELRYCLKDLSDWSKEMKETSEKAARKDRRKDTPECPDVAPPVRGKVDLNFMDNEQRHLQDDKSASSSISKKRSQAKHTYDYYRDKWDKFDIDRALAEVDEDNPTASVMDENVHSSKNRQIEQAGKSPMLHPSLMYSSVPADGLSSTVAVTRSSQPEQMDGNDLSVSLRSEGNNAYAKGEYMRAVDLYHAAAEAATSTPSNAKNREVNLVCAFSNMAMAHLKVHDWKSAEECSSRALEIDASLVKARQRRALARINMAHRMEKEDDGLGNVHVVSDKKNPAINILYDGAVDDLEYAASLEPGSKTIRDELCDIRQERVKTLQLDQCFNEMDLWHSIRQIEYYRTSAKKQMDNNLKRQQIHWRDREETRVISTEEVSRKDSQTLYSQQSPAMDCRYQTPPSTTAFRSQVHRSPLKTALEFESRWRSCGSNCSAKRAILSLLLTEDQNGALSGTRSIPTLFKSSLSGEMLFQILQTLMVSISDNNCEETFKLLEGFSCVERFNMGMMLLGKRKVSELANTLQMSANEMKLPPNERPEWNGIMQKYKDLFP